MEDENPFSKSKTIDPEVRAYVYSLVNALGGSSGDDDGRYVLGDDALAVLRDLKRWLKLYDEKSNRLDVARCLAESNVVRGDLLPIMSMWTEDCKNEKLWSRTALACLEVLVPLTWPLEHEEMTLNHHRHTPHILQAQVKYKAACLHWDSSPILRQAIRIALPAIAMKREDRTPRDEGIIKLVLYFLRNVAAIRQIPNLPSQGLDNEVSRSATIQEFRSQDVFALLLTMCSNMGEEFNLQDVVILEIIFNLVKGVNVEKLWLDETQRQDSTITDLKATLSAEADMHKDAKKKAWSRHGRFGTMIWVKDDEKKLSVVSGQDNIRDSKTAMFNMDNTKKWSKPLQRRKDLDHSMHDFDQEENLTGTATEQLRNFVEEFLDSGFNPLITHLRKAIEREAERLLPIDYRQFFYVVSWFLKAERVRREQQKKHAKSTQPIDPESFGIVAAVLNQETFITINRYMQLSFDEKAWQDLNASMRCFTEILLTVQEMAQSPLEEDQEIAENIQNRIFYEETTHDRVRQLLSGYKDQGIGYLDACTELSHVFLRMLERYSKENVDLQIRSKRKAKRKRQAARVQSGENAEQNADMESEHEDVLDTVQVSRERKFDFKRFAAKFVSQATVNTFTCLLKFYKDLTVEQLKRIHRFLHRVAFKQDMAVLLYRLDTVALLYKLVEGPEGLSKTNVLYGDWHEFVKQLLKKMFKKLDERPELTVELLFSKVPSTLYFLEHGRDRYTTTTTRPPAELEVKSGVRANREEQIGIVATVLARDGKDNLVEWVKHNIERAFDERHSWEAEAAARKEQMETDGVETSEKTMPQAEPSYISFRADADEIRTALFKNARLRLLLKLVGSEAKDGDDTPGSAWIVPATIQASHLETSKNALQHYTTTPWHAENPDDEAEDMLRRVRKETTRQPHHDEAEPGEAPRDKFIDDSEGEDDPDLGGGEFLFPDNPRTKRKDLMADLKAKRAKKRKRGSDSEHDAGVDSAEAEERRRRREANALARRRKIKSEAYVIDSDTDEEANRAFFEKEAEARKKQDAKIRKQMMLEQSSHSRKKKRTKKADSPVDESDDNVETVALKGAADNTEVSSPTKRQVGSSDMDSDLEETPPSSPPEELGQEEHDSTLKEIPQARTIPRRRTKLTAGLDDTVPTDDSGDEDENIVALPQRRARGGFVIEDDDDDE